MVYAGLGALLFCFYIIMDLQLIVGGKHTKLRRPVSGAAFGIARGSPSMITAWQKPGKSLMPRIWSDLWHLKCASSSACGC